ncbi:alpha/beta hydrolase [Epibacterium sp. MM17-32]|uniref:alpha/beta hydrolase n=1 Tax=Epibacterium sp. MM17-32 TaxID=2917734 RepID=UPI001EF628EB|nr:alpha/beta hydrolase [Epibacterium sp. MM17-32]MCG7627494.1 alpha/beta hydrolase [Epibacterium sp. MM17-32]
MDYEKLIDEETWTFIRETGRHYPEDSVALGIDEQREVYNKMAAAFRKPRAEVVEVTERTVRTVSVRIYQAGDPTRTVMYCHGGGFVVGDLNSHDDVCAEICEQTGYRVVSVDYRLAPENQHPAQFDDAWTVLEWIAETYDEGGVVLAGDSAGGMLSACVAHHARGRLDVVLGQVLIYPGLGGDHSLPSYREHAQAPMLTLEDVNFYAGVRSGGTEPAGDPTYAPLQDRDFSGLPPTVMFSADCDPLRDDCGAYRDAIRKAGGQAEWINEAGLVHGYLRARHSVGRARDSFERIVLAIEGLGQEIWPYDE